MRRLMRNASPFGVTIVGRRRLRFLFADFLVRMWLLYAFRRRTFPVPVTEKRFFAPLCVFIFGIVQSYFGVKIMIIDFPSSLASLSTLAMSLSAAATRSTTS